MNTSIVRFVYALLIALFVATGVVGSAYAQSSSPATSLPATVDVRLRMEDGWSARGKHTIADDFVIVCPNTEVLDPNHPCGRNSSGQIGNIQDFVLVCPVKEVLNPDHPCAARKAQIVEARPHDFVLVCPVKEVLDPKHPCASQSASQSASVAQFKMPGDYVMTCPVKEVLEPGHPCAGRSQ